MKLIKDISQFPKNCNTVITNGIFDGVHLGHVSILDKVVQLADLHHFKSVVLTYWPHPRYILNPHSQFKLLNTFEEKAQKIEEKGIDFLVCLPFTQSFSQLEPEYMLDEILLKTLQMKIMVVGYNHQFGKNRKGDFNFLNNQKKDKNFEVFEIEKQYFEKLELSSTSIRKYLEVGDVNNANMLLGYSYSIRGKVKHGDKIGRKIGFPTANLQIDESYKLLPQEGAYVVNVIIRNKTYEGMVNIGVRPTLNATTKQIEVHVFHFSEDIYDEEVTIEFKKKLRNEIKFNNLKELQIQLTLDSQLAKKFLKNNKNETIT